MPIGLTTEGEGRTQHGRGAQPVREDRTVTEGLELLPPANENVQGAWWLDEIRRLLDQGLDPDSKLGRQYREDDVQGLSRSASFAASGRMRKAP